MRLVLIVVFSICAASKAFCDTYFSKKLDIYNKNCAAETRSESAKLPQPLDKWLYQSCFNGAVVIFANQGWSWRIITGGIHVPIIPFALSSSYDVVDVDVKLDSTNYFINISIEELDKFESIRTYLETMKEACSLLNESNVKELEGLDIGYRARFVNNKNETSYIYFYLIKEGYITGSVSTKKSGSNRSIFILEQEALNNALESQTSAAGMPKDGAH